MMQKILIFKGPDKKFDEKVENEIAKLPKELERYSLGDLIKQLDTKDVNLTINQQQQNKDVLNKKPEKDIVIVHNSDFTSVNPHVILNFVNGIINRFVIQYLYIQNPPFRIEKSLISKYGNMVIDKNYNYHKPNAKSVLKYYKELQDSKIVFGQEEAKKQTCIGLFKQVYQIAQKSKPLVLLYYGPSGVGKTELAKNISSLYKGNLTRIQFSMMQTEDAVKYVFGSDNTHPSMARDLLARESNVVLIDEFDKVSPTFYNVFYQMFDEGKFKDALYRVNLENCIFILTSNFDNTDEIIQRVGMPIFSRIDIKIKFELLTVQQKRKVIKSTFRKVIKQLLPKDRTIIKSSNLQNLYLEHADDFNNIRMLNKIIENDIYHYLMNEKLKE